ncbi:MAG: Stf0 family sulfotransferase [Lentimicrobiaceae bacterium]|nr:Stf0 family sulfotransferase [Lentimicrobiaceae bacterium]
MPLRKGNKIIMTHLGRVGSTVLAEMLKQHPKIIWLDEYFTIKYQKNSENFNFSAQDMIAMLDAECFKVQDAFESLYIGHEIKPINFFHNPSCDIIDYVKMTINENKYTHIFLRRRNVFKRICSSYKAAQFNIWHILKNENKAPNKGFMINLKNLIDYDTQQKANTLPELIRNAIQFEERLIDIYKKLGIKFLEIFYEDDIEEEPARAYRKVISYLELDETFAEAWFKKTSRDLSEDIINYSDVEKQLRNSEYSWMLS